jgi:mRNA interferase MazF
MSIMWRYEQGSIFYCNLDPTIGREIQKSRPCMIISPNELNDHLNTFIIAPITTGMHPYQFRIEINYADITGCIILDQIRTVDKQRLFNYKGVLPTHEINNVLSVLQEMFAYS